MVRDINVASWTALGQMVMILSNAMVSFHISYKFVEGEIFNRASKVIGGCIFLASRQLDNTTNLMEKWFTKQWRFPAEEPVAWNVVSLRIFLAASDVNAIQVNFLERVKTSFGFESLKGRRSKTIRPCHLESHLKKNIDSSINIQNSKFKSTIGTMLCIKLSSSTSFVSCSDNSVISLMWYSSRNERFGVSLR